MHATDEMALAVARALEELVPVFKSLDIVTDPEATIDARCAVDATRQLLERLKTARSAQKAR